jgi:hypothetical protein
MFQGKPVYFNSNGTDYVKPGSYYKEIGIAEFEQILCSKIAAPKDFVRIQYNHHLDIQGTIIQMPYEGFSIIFEPNIIEIIEE